MLLTCVHDLYSTYVQGNQFFLREDEESLQLESISQRGGKRSHHHDAWDDLAANPLNDRYFSQPDLDRGSGRPRSRRHSEDLDPNKLPRLRRSTGKGKLEDVVDVVGRSHGYRPWSI